MDFAKDGIKGTAEDGDQKQRNEPGNLVGRIALAVNDVEGSGQGKENADGVKIGKFLLEEEEHDHQGRHLNGHEENDIQKLA